MSIEFPALFDFLGGTFVRQRYSGSLSEAAQTLSSASDDDDFRTGLLHAYSGELRQAWRIFDRLATSSSSNLQTRASKYIELLQRGSVLTVPFDMTLDAPRMPTVLCQVDFPPVSITSSQLQVEPQPLSAQEQDIFFWNSFILRGRQVASSLNPSSPIYLGHNMSNERNIQFMQNMRGIWQHLSHTLSTYGPGIMDFAPQFRAELSHIAGNDDDQELMDAAEEIHSSTNNISALACCKIIKGDWLISPPHSHVTALNLIVQDSDSSKAEDVVYEKWDIGMSLADANGARTRYQEAEQLFEAAASPRGIAAVKLRLGCLAILEAMLRHPGAEIDSAGGFLVAAHEIFDEHGDKLSLRLVETHQLILDIAKRAEESCMMRARIIGEWGMQSGSRNYVKQLGTLLLRYGRWQWLKYNAFDVALLAHRSAFELFSHSDIMVCAVQAKAAEADLLRSELELDAAASAFEDAHAMMKQILLFYQAGTSPHHADIAQKFYADLLVQMHDTFYYLRNTKMLDEMQAEISAFPHAQDVEMLIHARRSQSLLYRTKIEFKQKYREMSYVEARAILESGLAELVACERYDRTGTAHVGEINLLAELGRYQETVEKLSIMHTNGLIGQGLKEVIQLQDSRHIKENEQTEHDVAFHTAVLGKNFALARFYYDKLMALNPTYFNEDPAPRGGRTWEVLLQAGLMFEGQGDLKTAERLLKAAGARAERHRSQLTDDMARKTSFGHSDVSQIFGSLARVYIALYNDQENADTKTAVDPTLDLREEALQALERGKARALLDSRKPELLHKAPKNNRDLEMEKVYLNIPIDTVVIEYGISSQQLLAFVLTRQGIQYAACTAQEPMETEANIQRLLQLMEEARPLEAFEGKDEIQTLIQDLTKRLIKPLQDELDGKKKLIIVPSGSLGQFPFGILRIKNQPLLQLFEISEVPSLQLWLSMLESRELRRQEQNQLTEATVLTAGVAWDFVYGVLEACYSAKKFSTRPLVATKMRDAELEASVRNSSIVVISAHGEYLPMTPLKSPTWICDPPLTVADFSRMGNRADLIILSACFSGQAKILNSDDGFGFSHAILGSGASAFIGTLWPSNQEACCMIMMIFYHMLCSVGPGKITYSKALAIAQNALRTMTIELVAELSKELLETFNSNESELKEKFMSRKAWMRLSTELSTDLDWNDEYYWGPFVLVGLDDVWKGPASSCGSSKLELLLNLPSYGSSS